MTNIKGKTVVDFDISDSSVTLRFDDGSGVEFTASETGRCCCCDAEMEITYLDPPRLGPEPPPPPPARYSCTA